ncbi:hypothetical protein SEQ_HALENA_85 [Mycobacterium phage Halena]|uniref:Uncharacterized protein n=9 Tax=Bronvirus TaxID=1623278 RepID=E0YPM0_9CAUD|nr:hypothetical protein LEBRON_87 [Mycobacterium phage LeBron]YP_009635934.1 hypothetical protein FGG55_gp089 [Mycobacterium phage JoeDirt]YP_010100981.1 hypothetical protein KNU44_gp085 [Mycobacterium phage CicholasNage]YP_010105487.1 hypothetical protein KNU85_gp085 [Mycobacterium phage DirkDirk]YP_010114784.1 hypothetical protein KNV76_gp084 [Mycobacterium phage OhShagHennessy]AEK07660.1 hypothetical protein UPIE_87 [Mycobacterium phage UPIE]AEZ50765.1 hypothetical protein [Mycobacterium p
MVNYLSGLTVGTVVGAVLILTLIAKGGLQIGRAEE